MPCSIGTNNNTIVIVNQDSATRKLNCLITNDQTVNNQTPTTYDAICEIRSTSAMPGTLLLPSLSNIDVSKIVPIKGMIYYNSDLDTHVAVTETKSAGKIVVADTNGDILIDPGGNLIFNGNTPSNSTTIAANATANNVTMVLPGTNGSAGQYLQTDGAGNTSWQTTTNGTVTSIAIAGNAGISVSGSPITSNGTINLTLGSELQALNGLNASGFITRTAANTYIERAITAGSGNIVVTNGYGVGGNPTIDLNSTPIVSKITINNAPVANTDGVNKQYADALIAGLDFKNPCVAATTINLDANYLNGSSGVGATLTNNGTLVALIVDGYTANVGDRVLIKNQTDHTQNGIYSVTNQGSASVAWILTRTADYDTTAEITAGNLIAIDTGVVNADTIWLETSNINNVGSDPITFSQFSYGPTAFLQVINNLSDLNNPNTARHNLGLDNVIYADQGNPATIGYVPFSENVTGTQLVKTSSGVNIFADNTGQLTLTDGGGGITLNSSVGTSVFNGLNLLANLHSTALNASNALITDYALTFPAAAPTNNQMLLSDNTGQFTWVNEPVTSITAGTNLSGGTITTSGTIGLSTTLTGLTSVTTNNLKLPGGNNNTITVAASANSTTQYTFTLPADSGTSGYVLSTDGMGNTSWVPDSDQSGTVTSVATGTGLTGGPITSTGTVSLANTAVTSGNYNYGSFTVNSQGQLTSANSGFVNTNGTGAADTVGFATLNGTTGVTVNTSTVTANSIITVTRNVGVNTPPDVTTIGNLIVGSINATNSFTVYSTTVNDLGNFNWLIINP